MKKLTLNSQNKQGFTIIEIVLVLAIAGLIFLMVFLALPALQRSQRDTQRKSDVGKVIAAINSWKANNRGRSLSDMSTQVGGNGTTVNTVNATATNNPLKAYLGYSDTSNNPIADGDTSGDLSQHTRNLNLAIGTTGGLLATHSSGNNLNSNELNIYIATSCPDSTNWVAATNGRVKITFPAAGQNQAAVWVNLEGGGVYCENA